MLQLAVYLFHQRRLQKTAMNLLMRLSDLSLQQQKVFILKV